MVRGKPRFSLRFRNELNKAIRVSGTFPISVSEESPWTQKKFDDFLVKLKPLGYRKFVPAIRLSTDFRSPRAGTGRKREQEEDPRVYRIRKGVAQIEREEESETLWIRDEHIIQQLIELDYQAYREKRPGVRKVIDDVAALVSEITEGFPIKFGGIGEDTRGLFPQFITPDGMVPLNVLSQGTQSLIQWCAQLIIGYAKFYDFPKSLENKAGVLLVDEIDAHLHPSWQRRILPALVRQYPSLQIFCSAHSPMPLAGLKAGQVQLLKRGAKGTVEITRSESDIFGWSADEIYTSFLGVEPTDMATTEKLDRIRKLRLREAKLTSAERRELQSLREDVGLRLSGGSVPREAEALATDLRRSARGRAEISPPPTGRRKATRSSKRTSKKTDSDHGKGVI